MKQELLVGAYALGMTMSAYAFDKPYDPRLCVMANQSDYVRSISLPQNFDLVRRVYQLPYNVHNAEAYCRVNYSAPPGRPSVYAETMVSQNLGFLRRLPGGIFKHAGKLNVVGNIVRTPFGTNYRVGVWSSNRNR
jgi:hypothetical protein